jgi:hypothetical protein
MKCELRTDTDGKAFIPLSLRELSAKALAELEVKVVLA